MGVQFQAGISLFHGLVFRKFHQLMAQTFEPLLKPITLTVDISAADARLADSDEENILIQHHRDGS